MPNYSLVANNQFKARNFEDLLKPYAMYTQEYRAQEDALAELATKADVWEGLANEQTDPVAYGQYKNYADALKEQATVIADRGLDPSSRQAMLNLKRRYASEIVPIEQAYTNRKAQAEEQRKALLQNPTLMLSRRADTTSLDRYMENPNLGYESYSGALLTQQAGQAAAAIAKELRDYGNGKRLDGFTRTWLQQHGFTAGEVAFAINHPDDPRASKVLNTVVNNVMADSGMANWADNQTMNQAYSYARQGLWQAIGQTQITPYSDDAAKMALQHEYNMEELRARYGDTPSPRKDGKPTTKEIIRGVNPVGIYTVEEKENHSKDLKNIKSWLNKGYLMKKADGSIALTEKGFAHANSFTTPGDMNMPTRWDDSEFREFLKRAGSIEDKTQKVNVNWKEDYKLKGWNKKAFNEYMDILNGGYDANRAVEFVHDYGTPAEQERAKTMIQRALGNSDAQIVSYKGSEEGYSKDHKSISKQDFTENYKVLASKDSRYGQVFVVEDKQGKQFNIQVNGVHNSHRDAAARYYASADDAYKKMMEMQSEFDVVNAKYKSYNLDSAEDMSLDVWGSLSENEQKTLIDYYALRNAYADLIWDAEKEQGYITRGYKTDNIETE